MASQQNILDIKKGKVLSFGEVLLRICPDVNGEWLQNNTLPFYVGGAEANVAAALALWNVRCSYLSCVPDNMMGRQVTHFLQQSNIDTTPMLISGEKIGLYFLPQGSDLRNVSVIYDRLNSSFSQLQPGIIDWDKVLENTSWLHFSAICPAINPNVAAVCKEAVEAASGKNIVISIDLNYRAKLWQYGKQPHEVMPEIVQHCDVVMGNIWAAEEMLRVPVNNFNNNSKKEDYIEQALQSSRHILQKFPKVKIVANTFRFDIDNGINYYTTLYAGNNMYCSPDYHIEKIIDKVGSGDCFMAGLIYGFYNNLSPQNILNFATCAAVKKLHVRGDFTNVSVENIITSMKNNED